jgi:hypothetical protein
VRVPEGAGTGKAKVTLSLSGWKGMTVASATYEVPVEAPKAEGKADGGKPAEKPPAAKPAEKKDDPGADVLQAHRDRMLIEEQKLTQVVETALRKARRAYPDEPEAALKLLRQTLLQVWDHPDVSERVRQALLGRVLAVRRKLDKE